MNKSGVFFSIIILCALILMTATAISAGQSKANVCHITGTFEIVPEVDVQIGNVINIADPAYPAHLEHGDPEAWEVVTLANGDEVCIAASEKTVFVTSTVHRGNFGGIDAADAICQAKAEEAELPGIYKAWLSDSTHDARDRTINKSFTGDYVTADAARSVVAHGSADLLDGSLENPIAYNEFGNLVPSQNSVWTATRADGTLHYSITTCSDWTGLYSDGGIGRVSLTDYRWTYGTRTSCISRRHLYCFEQ